MSQTIVPQTPAAPHPTAPKARRFPTHFLRFSLRTPLLATVVLGLFFGWLGNLLIRVRHQRQVVAQITDKGGRVYYDYEFVGTEFDVGYRGLPAPGPKIVRALLGNDVYAYVVYADLGENTNDSDLACLTKLPRLQGVSISGPGATDDGLADLLRIPQLRNLSLTGTSISADGIAHLHHLKGLDHLVLWGADVSDEKLANIDQLAQLKYLQLGRAKVTSHCLLPISRLQRLETLLLYETPAIDDAVMHHIAELKHLRRLELLDTAVTDDGLPSLTNLPDLQHLALRIGPITDAGLRHIGELKTLTFLEIANNNIGDAGIGHLRNLPNLKVLLLGSKQITDAAIDDIAQLRQLSRLNLNYTSITKKGLSRLKSSLPDCQITAAP